MFFCARCITLASALPCSQSQNSFCCPINTGYTIQCRSMVLYYDRKEDGYTNLLSFKLMVKRSSVHKQIVSNRDSISMLRSVCWVKKWSLSAWPDGIVSVLHSSTGHFLSANTVLHSSLRMESEAKVPVGPRSSALSQPANRHIATRAISVCMRWMIQSLFQLVRAVCLDDLLF